MKTLKQSFDKVRSCDWKSAVVSFFIVKRKLVDRIARYEVFHVNVDDGLRKKLRSIVTDTLDGAGEALEYDFNTADLDGNLLSISTEETDLHTILERIQNDEPPANVDEYQSLLGSWMYISRLDLEGQPPLFSARRVSDSWKAKKIRQLVNMIFKGNMLIDLGEQEIFRVDGGVDFFSFDGVIFIINKRNFETALNFRAGMLRNRDEIVAEFEQLGLFHDARQISGLVGNNMRLLRKISQVKNSGYYKDPLFMQNLKRVNNEEGWGIEYYPDGRIVANEENIELILRVFNNDRLSSKVNFESFDVDVKHKI